MNPIPEGSRWHYVVTKNPRDIPGKVVVRGWIVAPGNPNPLPTNYHVEYDTYEAARLELEQSVDLACVPRDENDDPVIIETWI